MKKGEYLNSLQLAASSAVLHEFHIPRACAVLRVVMGGRQIKGEGGLKGRRVRPWEPTSRNPDGRRPSSSPFAFVRSFVHSSSVRCARAACICPRQTWKSNCHSIYFYSLSLCPLCDSRHDDWSVE